MRETMLTPERAAMRRLMSHSVRRAEPDLIPTVTAVSGLLKLAATKCGRSPRRLVLSGGQADGRMTSDDLKWMEAKGYLVASPSWVEITDKGNELAAWLVGLAAKGKGAGV